MFGIENYFGFIIAAIILTLTPEAIVRSVLNSEKMDKDESIKLVKKHQGKLRLTNKQFQKWAGALYLMYLGIKMFKEKNQILQTSLNDREPKALIKIYKQGIVTNILNPKVGLFFISFLPQFINQDIASGPLPFLYLGATFLVIGTIWSIFIAFAASYMTNTLRNNKRAESLLYKLSGIIFIGFGLKIAFNHD